MFLPRLLSLKVAVFLPLKAEQDGLQIKAKKMFSAKKERSRQKNNFARIKFNV